MLLKRGIGISRAKIQLIWLRKWAMRVVVNGKISAFCYKLVDHEIKKSTIFNMIRLHLQKKIIMEMFKAVPY